MREPRAVAARRQRGAAALIITMTLFFAMVLGSMFASRNLLIEQRTSADQYRSTQAFEAAEAGIEWALAQMNGNVRIGLDCLPIGDAAATSFRSRYVGSASIGDANASATPGSFSPTTWINDGRASVLQPICARYGDAWSCSCPDRGPATLASTTGKSPAAAFNVRFAASALPGVVRLVATGCTRIEACIAHASSAPSSGGASAHIEVDVGLIPGLRKAPVAAITTGGSFDSGNSSVTVRNSDPKTGIAIHAGSQIEANFARIEPPPGTPSASALISHDPALATQTADRFFATYFGLDKVRWRRQSSVKVVACQIDCSDALIAAIADAPDMALIWIDGDLRISRPVALGSTKRPVIIVVNGAAQIESAMQLSGVIYSASLTWSHSEGNGFVHGAALIESNYAGTATAEFAYDAALLAALESNPGTFARVNGTWRDF